jgi:hypothetical protein
METMEKKMGTNSKYPPLSDEEYNKKFGLDKEIDDETGFYKVKDRCLLNKAWEKAWEARDFEINKFWSRAAYFWAFIALIFGTHITVMAGKIERDTTGMDLDLLLILLGIIFSVVWLLVIRGSKRLQENWEAHIDKLEDNITGPLYKTIYCTKKNYYSVSRINEILAWVVIVTWILFFIDYLSNNYDFLNAIISLFKNYFFILIPILLTVICIFILIIFGRSAGGEYKVKLDKNEKGRFIDRTDK